MKTSELFRNSLKSLWQNKQRSFLTMIGIIIGISSVITILSLGRGFEKYTVKNLVSSEEKENVSTTIQFLPNDFSRYEDKNFSPFAQADLRLLQNLEGVKSADFPKEEENSLFEEITVRGKKMQKRVGFEGSTNKSLLVGRNLGEADRKARVAVVSLEVAREFHKDPEKILGRSIEFKGHLFLVVGVEKEASMDLFSMGEDITIPKSTKEFYFETKKSRDTIQIEIQKNYKPSVVTDNVKKVLSEKGSNASTGEYSILDLSELTDGIGKILQVLTYFISSIAGISLLIAGVGVMNMMYISVAERTKEIGIRRAMGAKRRDIRLQFLLEGVFLTLLGGIIGYISGFMIALTISAFLPFQVRPDLFTIFLAISVSMFIGISFSFIPANAAAKKDLIEILR